MNRKRATLNQNLFTAVNPGIDDNPKPLTSLSGDGSDPAVQPVSGLSAKYIPVYHIELVRDRSIKVEPRPAIHNPDDVLAILRDELLKADREKLICLTLNAKNVVMGIDFVSVGTLTASLAAPRLCDAAHNRPYVASILMFCCRDLRRIPASIFSIDAT